MALIAAAAVAVAIAIPLLRSDEDGPCDADLVFIGARGSGQGGPGGNSEEPPQAGGLGPQVGRVWRAVDDTIDGKARFIPLAYPAIDVRQPSAFVDTPLTTSYDESVAKGVAEMDAQIGELLACSDPPPIVLAGYSQGAEVVKSALWWEYADTTGPDGEANLIGGIPKIDLLLESLGAVILIGDTHWDGDEKVYRLGNSDPEDEGVLEAWPLPEQVQGRALTVCDDDDPVCSPKSGLLTGLGTRIRGDSTHAYDSPAAQVWLDTAGRWAALAVSGFPEPVSAAHQGTVLQDDRGEAWIVTTDGRYIAGDQCGAPQAVVDETVLTAIPARWGHATTCG